VQGDPAPVAGAMLGKRPNAGKQFARRLSQARVGTVDVDKLFTEKERADADTLIPALEKRLLQAKLKPDQGKALREYLEGRRQLSEDAIHNAIRLVMSTPEYQLT
jgi:hypothetical protein